MENTQKLSNGILVYSTFILSVLIYIFGVFSVIHFVSEASQSGFLGAFWENVVSITLGIICLFLAAPIYKLTKSLKILDITKQENGPAIITLYTPLFADDMPQADGKIPIQNLQKVSPNNYFNRLVELQFEQNGTERIIKSFISPKSLERLKNT